MSAPVGPGDARRRLGMAGESAVAQWYETRGWRVLARNWRCRHGELDIVLRSETTIVFCEVKTRTSARFGVPFEAVTATKQRRIRSLATAFLSAYDGKFAGEIRFDVAGVSTAGVEVIEGAF